MLAYLTLSTSLQLLLYSSKNTNPGRQTILNFFNIREFKLLNTQQYI